MYPSSTSMPNAHTRMMSHFLPTSPLTTGVLLWACRARLAQYSSFVLNSRLNFQDAARCKCPLVARLHSTTSVAATSKVLGNVSPSALAVFLLRTNSIFVGSSTGRSAGLAPFKILSTKTAARRHIAGWSAP